MTTSKRTGARNPKPILSTIFQGMFKTIKAAWAAVGGLSKPSKMPCKGYSIPAVRCKVGSKLRAIVNSVCFKCYALKGMYVFPNVKAALERRFDIVMRATVDTMARIEFRAAFVRLLRKETYFRWHDAGDIQNVAHLWLIVDIAKDNPHVQFWLPTRELNIVRRFTESGIAIPPNLTIRISAAMIDGKPLGLPGFPTSTVHKNEKPHGMSCIAYQQDGECRDCRACWNRNIPNISYPVH
jgi:hypothetical protein